MKKAEGNLLLATKALSYLKSHVAIAKKEIGNNFVKKGLPLPAIHSLLPALGNNISMHYSFDFAQQVRL